MSCISVLRIGPFSDDNICADQLRAAVVEHFEKLRSADDKSPSLNPTSEHQISIKNRYFSAEVVFAKIDDQDLYTGTWAEDGIVLVFDSFLSNPKLPTSMTASFDALQAVHERMSDTAGDLLRLCVGVGNSKTNLSVKEYEAEYARRVLWCLDRGYEYVEVDLSEEGVLQGHDARDKEGFARIVEALSGTVWSSAVMEKRKKQELKESYARDEAATAAGEAFSGTMLTYEPPDPSKLPPVLGSEEIEDSDREQKARVFLLKEEADVVNAIHVENDGKDDDTSRRRKDEKEEERVLNSLEGSLREAGRLRELSKSGQLSDDERRKRAGEAAILLMNMMGEMEFDESSDDDESLEGGKELKIEVGE